MSNTELHKHNYIILVSDDLKDKYPANKLSKLFNATMPKSKGGGDSNKAKGIYYDTDDSKYLNEFSKILETSIC